MRKGILGAALCFAVAVSVGVGPAPALAQDSLEAARKAGKILVGGANMGLKPYLWQNPDGTYQGAEYELTKYVVEKLGIPRFEYVVLEWASLIPGLKAKRFDLTGTIGITQERAQGAGISFSRPFLMIYDRVIVLRGSPIKGVQDLKGKTVASVLGTADSVTAHSLKGRGMVGEVKDFNAWGEPFLALRNRQVDAVLLDEQEAVARKQEMPEIELVGDPVFWIPRPEWAEAEAKTSYRLGAQGFAIRREDTKLLEAVNAAFDASDNDGTRERILKKYGMWNTYQEAKNLFK